MKPQSQYTELEKYDVGNYALADSLRVFIENELERKNKSNPGKKRKTR
jgi:hypothetical protein